MTKVKIEKFIVISFIGLIVTFFVGLGGNIVLKASQPISVTKTEVDNEKRIKLLEDDLVTGIISRREYDSLSGLLHMQMKNKAAIMDESHNPDKIPEWVGKLGITEPIGMKFDQVFSNYTTVEDPTEGFNSVSLVYNGEYTIAIEEASKIASSAQLSVGRDFRAKGNLYAKRRTRSDAGISYLNYSLGDTDKAFLISVQVEPSGRLTIMVTDNKQLNACMLAYEPLNSRNHSAAKPKKQ